MKGALFCMTFLVSLLSSCGGGIEEPGYRVLKSEPPFEIRQYESYLEAYVKVDSSFSEAGNKAFSLLFAYISGANSNQDEIAMTAPVTQKSAASEVEV